MFTSPRFDRIVPFLGEVSMERKNQRRTRQELDILRRQRRRHLGVDAHVIAAIWVQLVGELDQG
jgi:hypothetical protein